MTSTGVKIDIKYQDSDEYAYFAWNLMSSEEYHSRYASPEELIAEELKELIEEVLPDYQAYEDPEGTLIDILSRISDSQSITGLKEQTEYTVYAFGVSPEGEATTDLETYTFTTPAWEAVDPCTFAIAFSDVEQLQFGFTVTPSNEQTRYYIGLVDTAEIEQSSPEEVAAQFIRRANIAEVDWSSSKTLRQGVQTLHTYRDMDIADLEPDTDYSIMVFGMSALGERTTEVAYETVHTLPVPQSDMTFTFEVVETSSQGAVIKVIPSKEDETYMTGCIRKEEYLKYDGDDRAFMDYVVEYGGIVLLDGVQTLDRSSALLTDTEYICFAFGYIGGITTPLFYTEFETRDHDTSSKAAVAIEIVGKAHSTYDMAIYAYLTPNEYAVKWYAGAFNSVDGIAAVPFTGETLTDAEVINAITTNEDSYYWNTEYAACGAFFGREYTFYVIAEDAEGNFGPLVKKTVVADSSLISE